jgi:hypothetical protein
MEDLDELISWPDHLQYFFKKDFILATTDTVALPKISKSFANRR